jgi:membrane protein
VNLVLVKKTISSVIENRLTGLAAEIAFHSMLALFPGILAALTAMGLFAESIKDNLLYLMFQLKPIMPEEVGKIFLAFIQEIKITNTSWFSLSFIASFWGASVGMTTIMDALDQIHGLSRQQKRPFWKKKLISLILTLGTFILFVLASFLVLLSDLILNVAIQQNWGLLFSIIWQIFSGLLLVFVLVATIVIASKIRRNNPKATIKTFFEMCFLVLGVILVINFLLYSLDFVHSHFNLSTINKKIISLVLLVWRMVIIPLALVLVLVTFAFIYRFGCSQRGKEVPIFPGAITASFSWLIACNLFRTYVTYFGHYNKVYGTIGTVIILMLWLYLNALFFLLGEQINVVVAKADKNGK